MVLISKRFVLVSICFALLLGAVAAYAYVQVSNQKNHTETRSFNFEWIPYTQNVTPGKYLQMNLTFTLEKEGNLSIVAKINDDEFYTMDYFALLLRNSTIGTIFYACNETVFGLLNYDGTIKSIIPHSSYSEVHTCVYERDAGYTFFISLPPPEEPLEGDLIHICFREPLPMDAGVYVRFHLDILRQWRQ